MNDEIVPADDVVEVARELDSMIRQLARQAHVVLEALYTLVEAAKAQDIHEALGFPSWTAYIADALDGQWRLEGDKRGEAMKFLAAQGMSRRAIGRVVGTSAMTVSRELAGMPLGEVMGLDGKTYTPPPPVPPVTPGQPRQPPVPPVTPGQPPGHITIPATPEAAVERLEEIAAEEERLRQRLSEPELKIDRELRDSFHAMWAELLAAEDKAVALLYRLPLGDHPTAKAEQNSQKFGLMMHKYWVLARLLLAEGGLTLAEIAAAMDTSEAMVLSYFDGPGIDPEEFIAEHEEETP